MSSSETSIHPTAIVEKGAQLGLGVKVGPYAFVEAKAIVGDHVTIGSHCQIQGRTIIGKGNMIHSFCVFGAHPQDLTWDESMETQFICGEYNTFREYSNVSLGTLKQ